jgi:hypothetical protein
MAPHSERAKAEPGKNPPFPKKRRISKSKYFLSRRISDKSKGGCLILRYLSDKED